jgi:hypothetical protein
MAQTQAFTIAYWVNITAHDSAYNYIVGRPNGCVPCGPLPYVTSITNTGHLQTIVNANMPNSLNSTAVLTNGVWYHVALTFRDSSRILYINGVKDQGGSNNLVTGLNFPNMGVTNFGSGILDEVRFYDRVLTASQVAALYADTTQYGSSGVKDIGRPTTTAELQPTLPNPLYDLSILRADPRLYRIYDLSGRPLAIGEIKKSGVYLVEIISQRHMQKVVLLNK